MKRLVWILAVVWCTAFAQVQPVPVATDLPDTPASCCAGSCACAPDCHPVACAVLPAPGASNLVAETPGREVRRSHEAAPASPAAPAAAFYLSLLPRPSARPVPPVSADEVCADAVPLFVAHCSYLI